jgi:hypothetical protein
MERLTSGHGCFLAIKPNQPEDDGEYGVPDVALPNVALPIARGCLTKNPQYARPLVCGHEREANGTKQDKRGDHRQTFSPRRLCSKLDPSRRGPEHMAGGVVSQFDCGGSEPCCQKFCNAEDYERQRRCRVDHLHKFIAQKNEDFRRFYGASLQSIRC